MSIEKEKSDGESEAYEAKPIRRSTPQLKRRSEHGYEGGYNNYPQQVQTPQRQLQGRSKFVNVCDSQSCAPQPQPVSQNPGEGSRFTTTSWNGHVVNFGGGRNFGGLDLFCLNTNNFGVLAEETIDEIPHIEQHGTQSVTQSTLQSEAVTQKDKNPTSTSKDKRSTKETGDERGQKNNGQGGNSPRTPETQREHQYKKIRLPSRDREQNRPTC